MHRFNPTALTRKEKTTRAKAPQESMVRSNAWNRCRAAANPLARASTKTDVV